MPNDTFQALTVERQASLQGVVLATFRARAAAFIIDSAILAAVLMAPSLWRQLAAPVDERFRLSFEFGGLTSVVIAIAYFALSTYLSNGYTLGKWVLRIRVVSLHHERISLWHAVERALGYAASFLEAGFGFLQYFIHPNHQTVHDRIAETVVVAVKRVK